MVYCGRPSTACHACRVKRGKCDRKKPGCGQCARKRMPCPGYRDPSAVVIRDQTLATTRRAQAKQGAKEHETHESLREHAGTIERGPAPPAGRSSKSQPALISPAPWEEPSLCLSTLSLAPEDVATAFFFTSYAPSSPMYYLTDLANTLATAGLSASVILAPALAMLSRELAQPPLLDAARKHYANAIQQTNNALASPTLAVKDATLASVLLLALFEALSFHGRSSPTGWTLHIQGAAELLKMRGRRQFDSALGRSMFLDIAGDIFTSCAQRRVAVPPDLSHLLNQLASVVGDDDPEVGIARVAAGMAELTEMLTTPGLDAARCLAIVTRARALDAQIDTLQQQLTVLRPYTLAPASEAPATAYNAIAHRYSDPKACRHWNILRMMRLFVNKWIFLTAPVVVRDELPGFLALLARAAATAERMAVDILGTVPYLYSLPAASYARLMTGRWLIWPLSAVAASQVAPVSARIYARNALHALGHDAGIPQAAEAARMLDEAKDLEDWLHITHLS